jgi:hypothetical protein
MLYRYKIVSDAYKTTLAQEMNAKEIYLLSEVEECHVKDLCELLQTFYTITTWLCTQK